MATTVASLAKKKEREKKEKSKNHVHRSIQEYNCMNKIEEKEGKEEKIQSIAIGWVNARTSACDV